MSVAHGLDHELADQRQVPPSMVERMTRILDAFEDRSTRLTLVEVSRRTQLPRSTVHRILDQLVRLTWLEHTSSGYSLGCRSRQLGGGDGGRAELRAAAAPLLHELHLRTGLVAHLAVLDGADVEYLDKVGGAFALRVPSRVGGRMPSYDTALGWAMLAWLDPEEVDELAVQAGYDRAPFHQELGRIRANGGLAFERGRRFTEISCVAAAVRGPGRPVAAVSLAGDADTPLARVAPLVVGAVRSISAELFPQPQQGPGRARLVSVGPARTQRRAGDPAQR